MSLRLPESEFRKHPWRIHEVTQDFDVEDVWQLPGAEPLSSFPQVVEFLASYDPADSPQPVRFLWAARWKLGEWFGWDDDSDSIGARVSSLRERLPEDLRAASPRSNLFSDLPFDPLYELADEFAAEIANKTMHGVLHLGAVPAEGGLTSVQMTVLVKTNGLFGRAYMAAIKPFRYAIVYPVMIRSMTKRWALRRGE